MAGIVVRNLSDETHRALKARARAHGHSMEAEVRNILDEAVAPPVGLGSLLMDIFHSIGGIEIDLERDRTPHEPLSLDS